MAELKATVTHAELCEWAEYYAIEPWGEAPADLRAGIVASTFANCHLREDADLLTPLDFMPRIKAEEESGEPDTLDADHQLTPQQQTQLRRAVLFGIRPEALQIED